MKRFIVVLSLVLSACGGGGGGDEPAQPAPVVNTCYQASGSLCVVDKETVDRSRINAGNQAELKTLFTRMKAGGHFVIGGEGGSITVGEKGWPDISKTYMGMVLFWFQNTFPQSTFELANDAVSGTNTIAGLARYPVYAQAKKPDIVFVEFSVNDGIRAATENPAYVTNAYFAMLDMVKAHGAIPVSVETMIPNCNNAESAHFPAAVAANVMMVSEKSAICAMAQSGELKQDVWNADGVHPNAFGHQLLANLITKNLEKAL